mmetsp:Transcript_101963/g.263527  ORF Transcript_101963/g.263527 Transcript_101963/m.263527 type:complete len:116 (-) Transcript_101963:2198-2545(-)
MTAPAACRFAWTSTWLFQIDKFLSHCAKQISAIHLFLVEDVAGVVVRSGEVAPQQATGVIGLTGVALPRDSVIVVGASSLMGEVRRCREPPDVGRHGLAVRCRERGSLLDEALAA